MFLTLLLLTVFNTSDDRKLRALQLRPWHGGERCSVGGLRGRLYNALALAQTRDLKVSLLALFDALRDGKACECGR